MAVALGTLSACKRKGPQAVRLASDLRAEVPADFQCSERAGTTTTLTCARPSSAFAISWSVWKLVEPRPIDELLRATTHYRNDSTTKELSIAGTKGVLTERKQEVSFVGWRGGEEKLRLAVTATLGNADDLVLFKQLLKTTRLENLAAFPEPKVPASGALPTLGNDRRSVQPLFETDTAGPASIAADDEYVYWTNECDGTVVRKPARGGAIETLATAQARPTQLKLGGPDVYWINEGRLPAKVECLEKQSACSLDSVRHSKNGSLMRRAKKGGHPQVLASGLEHPRDVAFGYDTTYVLLAGARPRLEEYDRPGHLKATFPTGALATELGFYGGKVYWASPLTALGGSGPAGDGEGTYVDGIATDGAYLYALSSRGLWRLARAGEPARELAPPLLYPAARFTAKDRFVWFSHCGQVSYVDKSSGGGATIFRSEGVRCEKQANGSSMAGGGVLPVALATDADYVYWVSRHEPLFESGEGYECKVEGGVYRARRLSESTPKQ